VRHNYDISECQDSKKDFSESKIDLGTVVHTCNPGHMGDRDRREDHGVKLAVDNVRTMRKEKKTSRKS
jgi:hypothetical protein